MGLKSHLNYYLLAWKEFKQSKGYRLVKALHLIAKIIIFIVFGYGLIQLAKILYPLLPLLAWFCIGLGIAVIILALVIHFLGRFHERKIGELKTQHEKATGLFHRNADIIARFNYFEGEACQLVLDCQARQESLPEDETNGWAKRVLDYMKHYELHDYVNKFANPELTHQLPELIPSNPDLLRKARLDARRDLLREFSRELRNQAINSPYGDESHSMSLSNVSRDK